VKFVFEEGYRNRQRRSFASANDTPPCRDKNRVEDGAPG
jgi:hypothetical protein